MVEIKVLMLARRSLLVNSNESDSQECLFSVCSVHIKTWVEFSAERLTHFLTVRHRRPPRIGIGISVGTLTGFDVRGIAV